ncbi:MAG: tetratricopeptide repeat protein [Chitinophagaceae bacterium]
MSTTKRPKPLSERTTKRGNTDPMEQIQFYYETHKKTINGVSTAVVLIAVAVFGYFRLYLAPREAKASSKIFYAQEFFAADSLDRALQGDGQHAGFLKIIRDYSGTKTANLAHYYAGICYLHLGDPKKAIKQLEDFDGKGTLLATAAEGALGSAYLDDGKVDKAISSYKKASENQNDIAQTPMYLQKLGVTYEIAKRPDDAKAAYIRIRDNFPTSPQARDIDRTLARLGVLN